MKKLWDTFFFNPINASTLGLFRVFYGITVLLSLVGRFPDRELFYGPNAIISRETANSYFFHLEAKLNLAQLVPSDSQGLMVFFVALIIVAGLFTLGVFSRITSVLLWLGLTALSNRDFMIENSGDDLMRILGFYLMFAPSGAALSLDRLFFKDGKNKSAWALINPWAFRLMQLQVAYVYLDTFYLKLWGISWLDGAAIYYAFHYFEMQRFSARWILTQLWEVKLATWSVLLIEGSFGLLIWFRSIRYWILGAAFLLHLGINLTMQFPVFQYVMMSSLLLFIYPDDISRTIGRVPR